MAPSKIHPAIRFEALPASYGDALLVTCTGPSGDWRMLVDTGPDECWPMLKKRLAGIPVNAEGRRHIDLVLMDLRLPDTDGQALTRAIRQRHPGRRLG